MKFQRLNSPNRFKLLSENEVSMVSGGQILVQGDPFVGSIRPEDLANVGETFASAFGSIPIVVNGQVDGFTDNQDPGALADASNLLAVWPLLLMDTDREDFEEFLRDETNVDPDSVIIVTGSIDGQDYALHYGPNGFGAIYKITQNITTDDDFTYFADIQVLSVTTSGSVSAGLSNTGGTLGSSSGFGVSFKFVGTGG